MLTTTQSYVTYQGNGSTTSFPYSFPVAEASFLQVSITNNNVSPVVTTVLSSSQYCATGIGNGTAGAAEPTPGGVVTYPTSGSGLATGWTITIQRIVPYTQPTSLANQGGLWPAVVEAALDGVTMQTQQLAVQCQQLQSQITQLADEEATNVSTGLQAYIINPVAFPANLTTQSLAGLASVYETANTEATTLFAFSKMTAGHFFKLIIGDTYTTIAFASWQSGLAAGSIIGHQGQTVAFNQGDVLDCVSDGTYVYVIDSEPMIPPFMPTPTGLEITNENGVSNGITVYFVSASLVGQKGGAQLYTNGAGISFSYKAEGGTFGGGGLDTGSLTPNTWYYVWLIASNTTIKAMLSTSYLWSGVAKTYIPGYTFGRLAGCALTNSSTQFIAFHQFGNEFLFDVPQSVSLAAESAYTEVITAPLPPIAVKGLYQVSFAPSSGVATFNFSADGTNDYIDYTTPTSGGTGGGQFEMPLITSPAFWYKNANINGTPSVSVRGFALNL